MNRDRWLRVEVALVSAAVVICLAQAAALVWRTLAALASADA